MTAWTAEDEERFWASVDPPDAEPDDVVAETPHGGAESPEYGLHFVDGASFILDAPDRVPAIWGHGQDVLWSRGESLIIGGPQGVGKTTLAGQLVRGLLGLAGDVLGYPVTPAEGRVLYLAMDRPEQVRRALRRCFRPAERGVLAERLTFWKGPPPADLARHPEILAALAEKAGASVVVVDSLKDAAIGLSEDEVGAGYNRARQIAIAAGVDVLELHHVVKRGPNGAKPTTLADVYGSVWLTSGAGSVVLLWGVAGDPIVELTHLKQPAEPVGPLRVLHDHDAGTSSVWHSTDPLAVVRLAGDSGRSAHDLACVLFETEKPTASEVEKARRKLEKLVKDGLAEKVDGGPDPRGGPPRPVYRALTEALTVPKSGDALTLDSRTHGPSEGAGRALTEALTPLTPGALTIATPPVRGGASEQTSEQPACQVCGEALAPSVADVGTHPTCCQPERTR